MSFARAKTPKYVGKQISFAKVKAERPGSERLNGHGVACAVRAVLAIRPVGGESAQRARFVTRGGRLAKTARQTQDRQTDHSEPNWPNAPGCHSRGRLAKTARQTQNRHTDHSGPNWPNKPDWSLTGDVWPKRPVGRVLACFVRAQQERVCTTCTWHASIFKRIETHTLVVGLEHMPHQRDDRTHQNARST